MSGQSAFFFWQRTLASNGLRLSLGNSILAQVIQNNFFDLQNVSVSKLNVNEKILEQKGRLRKVHKQELPYT